MSVSLVVEVAGFQRTMTYRNGTWDGYDLTHPFLDDRSTVIYGPSQNTVFEQEAFLGMLQAASGTPQLSQPSQLSAFQHQMPRPVPKTPGYSGSPAFGAPRLPTLASPTSQSGTQSAREPSGSRLPPLSNLDLTLRDPGEEAVFVALQAVANYPDPIDLCEPFNSDYQGKLACSRLPLSPEVRATN